MAASTTNQQVPRGEKSSETFHVNNPCLLFRKLQDPTSAGPNAGTLIARLLLFGARDFPHLSAFAGIGFQSARAHGPHHGQVALRSTRSSSLPARGEGSEDFLALLKLLRSSGIFSEVKLKCSSLTVFKNKVRESVGDSQVGVIMMRSMLRTSRYRSSPNW